MDLKKKRKPEIGQSKKINGTEYIVEELFIADSVRWVRTSTIRKKISIKFDRKKYTYYVTDNKYFTEFEWIRN